MNKNKSFLVLILVAVVFVGINSSAKDRLVYPLDGNTEVQQYMKAFENFYNTAPEAIIDKLLKFVQTHPQSSLSDEALLKAGELAEKIKNYSQALSLYQKVVIEYPQAQKLEESFLWRNYISDPEIAAINELYSYYASHPNYAADVALLRMSNCYKAQSKFDLAQEMLQKLIAKYPDGLWEEVDLDRIKRLQKESVFPLYGAAWWRPHREAYLQLAALYQKQGQIDQAIEMASLFLEKFGRLNLFWEVKDRLATLYAQKNETNKAQEILEKTLQELRNCTELNSKDKQRLEKLTKEKLDQYKVR